MKSLALESLALALERFRLKVENMPDKNAEKRSEYTGEEGGECGDEE